MDARQRAAAVQALREDVAILDHVGDVFEARRAAWSALEAPDLVGGWTQLRDTIRGTHTRLRDTLRALETIMKQGGEG
jgi:hypothetical protein